MHLQIQSLRKSTLSSSTSFMQIYSIDSSLSPYLVNPSFLLAASSRQFLHVYDSLNHY